MSYCRTSAESDIYAYPTDGAFIIHLGDEMFVSQTLEEFKGKLTELRQQGYKVPQRVFNRIEEEISGPTKRATDVCHVCGAKYGNNILTTTRKE